MKIGDMVILWEEEYSLTAYKDQMGRFHAAYIVLSEHAVTITDTRKVPGMFSRDMFDGFKGVDKNGKEFFCNWESFPDDTMTPTYYWRDTEKHFVDAEQAYNFGFIYVNKNGKRVIPQGYSKCKNHDQIFKINSGGIDACFKCYLESRKVK